MKDLGNTSPHDVDARLLHIEKEFLDFLSGRTTLFFDIEDLVDLFYFEIDKADMLLAEEVLNVGRKQHPDVNQFFYLEGVFDDENGNYKKALKKYLAYPNEEDEDWNFLCFSAYCRIHDIGKAQEAAERIVATEIGKEYFLADIVELLIETGEQQLACSYLAKALECESLDKASLIKYSLSALDLDDMDLSYRLAERIIEQDPYNEVAWCMEAHALAQGNKFEEALSKLEYVFAINPDNAQALLEAAKIYILLDKLDEAEKRIEYLMELGPKKVQAYHILESLVESLSADIAYWKKDYRKASKLYYNNYKKDNIAPNQLIYYADCKIHLHRWKDAEKLLREAIDYDPKSTMAMRLLSQVYLQQQKLSLAIKYIERCIKLEPKDEENYALCAMLLFDDGQEERGKKLLEKSLRLFPDNWRNYVAVAVLKYIDEMFDEAKEYLRKALALEPSARDIFLRIIPQGKSFINAIEMEISKDNQ